MIEHRTLYGDYSSSGVELRWHRGYVESYADSLHQGALHIIFNQAGEGILLGNSLRVNFSAGTMLAFHHGSDESLIASRKGAQETHDFLVLIVSETWLRNTFGSRLSAFHPDLRSAIENSARANQVLGKVRSMSLTERGIVSDLCAPPVEGPAQRYWFMAKVLEILTHHLFAPTSTLGAQPFCSMVKQRNSERVAACNRWLEEHLDENLDLSQLAECVGCAPHYLSRQYKQQTGITLKQQHRKLRIEKAAELLEQGDYNVTEAAMEVGYSSLSHFSKAFHEETGRLPSEMVNTDA
ncbi:helix-turn-helix domain-containing protein [Rubritalea marina]|uniref:helix-turn-helix domain-containing protein n=1 Tax=Rubritalea marina TaxID=361055 RepID=UPI0003A99DA8|nr:AraC family transcriptional regulator [Rubritalea marina]